MRALASRIITDSYESRITRVVAVGDHVISAISLGQKFIEQMILAKRLALPDEMPIESDQSSDQRIGDTSQLIIAAARLLGRAGVMNITDYCNRDASSHVEKVSGKLTRVEAHGTRQGAPASLPARSK